MYYDNPSPIQESSKVHIYKKETGIRLGLINKIRKTLEELRRFIIGRHNMNAGGKE